MCILNREERSELIAAAKTAASGAYAPYSGFSVGAALLCNDGTVFTGCNIENASYSVTVCAERVALFAAVSAGHRSFKAIAVVGGKDGDFSAPCPPCGVCRQALWEFCPPDMPVILAGETDLTLDALLPLGFGKNSME